MNFVLRKKGSVVAIELKSNAEKCTEGLDKFRKLFHPQSAFIVEEGGISGGFSFDGFEEVVLNLE